jgi:ABC-type uncharacterized transport system substrate-binding protein
MRKDFAPFKASMGFLSAFILFLQIGGAASAHPHILISAKAELQFNQKGQVVGVRNIWDFDEAFSAYSVQGYDSKRDGRPTRKDLQPLADINVKSLSVYQYFTRMKLDGALVPFGAPKDYWDEFANDKLTLRFTLPMQHPVDVRGKNLEVDVYDPEYFAAITFAKDDPIKLVGAKDCMVEVHRPQPLDANIASQLAVIPADQRELPDNLSKITEALVNGVVVSCL